MSKPEEKHVRVGVAALIRRDGKILMGRRMGKNGQGTWSPPGGHLDNGETPEETAVRETLEETGLVVTGARFVAFTNDLFPDEPGKHYLTLWMVVDWQSGEPVPSNEMTDFIWVTFNELPRPMFLSLEHLLESPFFERDVVPAISGSAKEQ